MSMDRRQFKDLLFIPESAPRNLLSRTAWEKAKAAKETAKKSNNER